MAGFIKLYRGWRDCIVFEDEPFTEREAWVWLIENAAWKDTVRRTGQGGLVKVARGQLHTSLRNLGAVWKWPKSTVERYITRLETGTMVDRQAGHTGMILTICNYEKYQGRDDEARDSRGTDTGTVAGQSRDTQEECKEGKEGKKGGFAFHGRVIKLTEMDMARWKSAYHLLDLPAALQNRDDWLASQPEEHRKRWFQSTSSHLAKLQQEAADKLRNQPKPIKVGI